MARQRDLFAGAADAPRRPRRVTMHVMDAGHIDGVGNVVRLLCPRCEHDSGWVRERSVSAEKRGRPCPICNPNDPEAQALAKDEEGEQS